ncbi:MAG: PAS domain S-box protein, partial [Planctomycetales bacterium]
MSRFSADPIVIEDLDGRVLELNDAAVETYGYSRAELIGRPAKTIVPKERHEQADDYLRRCRAGEVIRAVEGVRVTKKRRLIHVLTSYSLLADESRKSAVIASCDKDVSSLRRRLSRVFMDSADPIVIEDLTGVVLDLNHEAEQAYRWDRDELIGRPLKTIVPEDRHGQADELLQRCLNGEEVRNVEGLRITREGKVLPVLITLSLMYDEDERPAEIASIAKDITCLRKVEEKLRRLNEDLESQIARRTSELAAANERLKHELAVAHELASDADRKQQLWLQGESIAVRALRESVQVSAKDDLPLLMTGRPGAGEEGVARAVHRASSRADRPF